MVFAMIGMFAVTSWQSGRSVGLLVYLCLIALLGCVGAIQNLREKKVSKIFFQQRTL